MTTRLHLLAATLATCATLTALPAQAQMANNLYIGGSLGQTRYKGGDIGGFSTDRSDKGGKLFAGYAFSPMVALELGYADLGSFNSAVGSVDGSGIFLDVVGKMPFTPHLSGIARVGAFNGKTDFSSSIPSISDTQRNTQPKVGLGLQYDFTKNLALRGEWERYRLEAFGNKANTDMVSVGVNFKL